ncbi:uncharacterized protein LOC142173778 [Nicotiana tabacum]|uniref:Uncharacterized protein LOC142173778 n=1 Tax=Nicotiana tabacum TaxID=4097 RepID=A0AC58TE89_TOBAC
MAGNEVASLDHNHPLFLQSSDAPRLVLIPLKLTGPDNYALWSRVIKLALREKSKLGFVDGTCVKSMYRGELAEQWEKCNAIILSWIGRIISTTLRQGTDPVTTYFSKMKYLWDELDFLMGLNERYSNIRSNVLAKRPVVTVNEAYAIVTQEESKRSLGVVDTHKEPLTMLAGRGQDFKGKRPGIICEHCGYKGHLKENCFKIIGYPADFKSKRKNQTGGGKVYTNSVNVNNEEGRAAAV